MALLDRIIWQIETSLGETITLDLLAETCAVSVFHMCRAFHQGTGMSIMTYVRRRRLSIAAKAIAYSDEAILSIAIKSGYASHEAFTRAFATYFGVLPSSARDGRSISTLCLMEPLKMDNDMIVNVPKPEIRDQKAFRVVGLSAQCSFENTSAIPALWRSFNAREGDVQNAEAGAAYGVCCDADETGRFRYVAGVQARGRTDGMDHVDVPGGRYAVFNHIGHISDLPKTVYTIWNKSLPDLGLEPEKSPDFERYDRRFDPLTGRGKVEIWIPVS
ncbi:AraC family transcriptional regulator [Ovoidimarina sediminis]|uniref:AraC family transcriptional regulator n=1 Tax=Ovoidimarina sediminis TaxID=3079856 RepID=UPI00290CE001|nr:AraC family transcriptional regulator [Rhodophyticola sp. MJ-SS7]MDU8946271.1 AraC family transcriptional regulator [Rhodophyticola sp. MJ-SS7]